MMMLYVINNSSNNDDAIHGQRTDLTDLKLISIYFFLLWNGVNFLKNFAI